MNKITAFIAGLFVILGLSACTTTAEPRAESPTVTVTETPQPTTDFDKTEEFIAVVREGHPELADVPDSDLIGIAESACGMLDEGASMEQVLSVVIDSGASQTAMEAVAFTIGAGVGAFCPEYEGLIDGGSTL